MPEAKRTPAPRDEEFLDEDDEQPAGDLEDDDDDDNSRPEDDYAEEDEDASSEGLSGGGGLNEGESEADSEDQEEADDAGVAATPTNSAARSQTQRSRSSRRRRSMILEDEESDDTLDNGPSCKTRGSGRESTVELRDVRGSTEQDDEEDFDEELAMELASVPSRMTKRQRAVLERQARQASGEREQWDNMELPDGLGYNWKSRGAGAAAAGTMTEEQQLKRLEASNRRKAHKAKKLKEEEETVKARIRAATSAKFRAKAEKNAANEAAAEARRNRALEPGFIRVKMQPHQTTLFWPADEDPTTAFPCQPPQAPPVPKCDVALLGLQPPAHSLKAGCTLLAMPARNDTSRLLCMSDSGDTYGFVKLEKGRQATAGVQLTGVVRTVTYCKEQPGQLKSVVLRLQLGSNAAK